MYDFNQRQLEKLQRLRDNGINPYPNGLEVTEHVQTLVSFGEELTAEELESVTVEFTIAGRLRFKNLLGKIGFGRIQQDESRVQICVKKQVTDPESFKAFKSLDAGDWVWARGTLFRTKTGELTLLATELKLYAKCIEGMPDKKVGVNNPETRQRMRYLDLIVNDDVMETFKARSYIIRYIRNFLEYQGFIGVETPILQPIPGGASAKPFVTHHNSLDTDMYMRVAPELYLKRLLVGGFEKVYEIGKNFRNEGISTRHNPEFTMVEFYQAHATYEDLIKLTQNMIVGLVMELHGRLQIPYGELSLDFSAWGEVRYDEAIRAVGVGDPWSASSILSFLEKTLSVDRLEEFRDPSLSDLQQFVFDEYVESQLVNPTFVTHYPTEISPLARMNENEPRVTDRFELFIAGQEIANGFSELNDPVDQANRFATQAERKANGDEEAMYFDSDYIKALSYGMPPAAGEGIGIDRLVMLLTNKQSIREVVLFPTLRRT